MVGTTSNWEDELRGWLKPFLDRLGHKARRRMCPLYVAGLIGPGDRKSVQPMAERLAPGDYDQLHHFVSAGVWNAAPLETELLIQADRLVGGSDAVLVIDDTAVPKKGTHSVGVAAQYASSLGKTANCQSLVSVNAASDRASCPLGWRLFLPASWDEDEDRRRRARIPEDVRHVPKWQLALEIIDQLIEWGLPRQVVQADGGYGDSTLFRTGLEDRGLEYVVQVKGVTSAQPADAVPVAPEYQGRGRPPKPRYPEKPVNLRDLVLTAGQEQTRTVGWREGDRGPLASQFIAIRVRPANDAQRDQDGVLPERWLLAEWPEEKQEPVKYWISNLPAATSIITLVRLAKLRWRVEHDYRELKQCLGLDHYEGRTFTGLHHHLTCVTVAHAFLTCCRLARGDPNAVRPQTAAA